MPSCVSAVWDAQSVKNICWNECAVPHFSAHSGCPFLLKWLIHYEAWSATSFYFRLCSQRTLTKSFFISFFNNPCGPTDMWKVQNNIRIAQCLCNGVLIASQRNPKQQQRKIYRPLFANTGVWLLNMPDIFVPSECKCGIMFKTQHCFHFSK